MKRFINYIIECHNFFFKESKSFVGIEKKDKNETYYYYPLKTLLYLPIAYFKFMYYCITTQINHNKK